MARCEQLRLRTCAVRPLRHCAKTPAVRYCAALPRRTVLATRSEEAQLVMSVVASPVQRFLAGWLDGVRSRPHGSSWVIVGGGRCLLVVVVVLALESAVVTTRAEGQEDGPSPVRIMGVARDVTGAPLPGATVEVEGVLVAISNDIGEFSFESPRGAQVPVAVQLPGFDSWTTELVVQDGATVDAVLDVAGFVDRVTVTPAAAEETVIPRIEIDQLRIFRTPGAQGDVFRSIGTLPGVTSPDDGAGLFVRGGDVSEVTVSLDDAIIAHPYRNETPTGGFRGAVDPLLISNLAFGASGFSARYGNVLSAVVDLRGLGQPIDPQATVSTGLAGASASIALPVGERLGMRGSVNQTFTDLLFDINGAPRTFDPAPGGWDVSGAVAADLGTMGRLRGFGLVRHDEIGVELARDAFVGLLTSRTEHRFVAGRWDVPVGSWIGSVSVGDDAYTQSSAVGVLDLATETHVTSWRAEAARGSSVVVGVNGAVQRTGVVGIVPVRGADFDGVFGTSEFVVDADDWHAGAYLETTLRLRRVSITPSVRVDRFRLARATTLDPRVGVRIPLRNSAALRGATGLYHQVPNATYYDRVRGADRLRPMRAFHYVFGYEQGQQSGGVYLRAEAYYKDYSRLPLEDVDIGFSDKGYGSARGADLFIQWIAPSLQIRWSLAWLDASRRWTPANQRERYEVPKETWTPDFEIPWSTQLTANVPLPRDVTFGVSWRSTSGRPHTPVVDAVETEDGFAPMFGPINSERLPWYGRFDLALSQVFSVGPGAAVWYVSVDNVFGRANVFDYAYSKDYSARREVTNSAPRSFYVGVTFRM